MTLPSLYKHVSVRLIHRAAELIITSWTFRNSSMVSSSIFICIRKSALLSATLIFFFSWAIFLPILHLNTDRLVRSSSVVMLVKSSSLSLMMTTVLGLREAQGWREWRGVTSAVVCLYASQATILQSPMTRQLNSQPPSARTPQWATVAILAIHTVITTWSVKTNVDTILLLALET